MFLSNIKDPTIRARFYGVLFAQLLIGISGFCTLLTVYDIPVTLDHIMFGLAATIAIMFVGALMMIEICCQYERMLSSKESECKRDLSKVRVELDGYVDHVSETQTAHRFLFGAILKYYQVPAEFVAPLLKEIYALPKVMPHQLVWECNLMESRLEGEEADANALQQMYSQYFKNLFSIGPSISVYYSDNKYITVGKLQAEALSVINDQTDFVIAYRKESETFFLYAVGKDQWAINSFQKEFLPEEHRSVSQD